MGRYTGPVCKRCRREGMKLFLKGDRCYMAKCPIETGRPPPGGMPNRRTKQSDYGVQLREKQRLRRMYGLQEKQFRSMFDRAAAKGGVTGEILLQLLEMRLDNLAYRLGFSSSRAAARLFVSHGHVLVNGKSVNIPSYTCRPGDVLEVRARKDVRENVTVYLETAESRGISPWLKLDKKNFRGEVLHVPTREEISPQVNEQLIVELYSK